MVSTFTGDDDQAYEASDAGVSPAHPAGVLGGRRLMHRVEDARAELLWWLDVLATANDIFAELPRSVREEIDAGQSPRELARMAVHLASISSATRAQIEATIRAALGSVVSPPAARGQLRLLVQP